MSSTLSTIKIGGKELTYAFFHRETPNGSLWVCRCGKKCQQKGSGYTNLVSHITRSHHAEYLELLAKKSNSQIDKFWPELNATVEADFPEDVAFSPGRTVPATSSVAAKKKKRTNEVMDSIHEYNSSTIASEVAKQKLFHMQNEEIRRQQEENRQQEEKIRRDREELRLQEEHKEKMIEREEKRIEHQQKMQRNMLEEWEKIQENILRLGQHLRDESLDEESRRDIAEDIAGLRRRKNQLAIELGFKTA